MALGHRTAPFESPKYKRKIHGFSLVTGRRLAMLMNPRKGETAVHGCHCPRDMAVRMREVMARPWVGVCEPLALIYW